MNFVSSNRDQAFLLPPDLRDWVPDDDLAHFVAAAVEHVPLDRFTFNARGTGSAQYHPRMMLALLVYCYATGIFSSRRIERATHLNVAVRHLTADTHPDHDTIAKFRRENAEAVREMFLRVLQLAAEMRVLRLGTVSVDGTKIDANASKHRSVSYARACELREQLELEVAHLMEQAEQADQSDEQVVGSLQGELADRQKMLERMKEACDRIEARRRAQAATEGKKVEAVRKQRRAPSAKAAGSGSLPLADPSAPVSAEAAPPANGGGETEAGPAEPARVGSVDAPADAAPAEAAGEPEAASAKPTDHHNFTDPDSRLMRHTRHHAVSQSYNAQAAVDTGSHLIVGARVSQNSNDRQELDPSVAAIPAALGKPGTVLADNGYASESQVETVRGRKIDVLVATGAEGRRRRHDLRPQPPPRKPRQVRSQFLLDMRERLKSEAGRALYKLRQQTVEPVFGTIKATMGFRRFLMRGEEKVGAEWQLVALAYNLRRMHTIGASSAATA